MPIFEYRCNQCDKEFEKLVFRNDDTPVLCPECNGKDVVKKMSAASLMGKDNSSSCSPGPASGFS